MTGNTKRITTDDILASLRVNGFEPDAVLNAALGQNAEVFIAGSSNFGEDVAAFASDHIPVLLILDLDVEREPHIDDVFDIFRCGSLNPEEAPHEPLPEALMDRFVLFPAFGRLGEHDIVTTLPTDLVFNAITENTMPELGFKTRCFTTIGGSFKGVNERIVAEIALLEKRDFDVTCYRDALQRVIETSMPFAGLMVQGGQATVDADIVAAIERTFSLQHELDGNIRTANWYLDELAVANRQFTRNSEIEPRKLKLADGQSSSMMAHQIAFAADPTELKQSSLAALQSVKGHVEKRDMAAAQQALTAGKAFSGRMHMVNLLVERGKLVVDQS